MCVLLSHLWLMKSCFLFSFCWIIAACFSGRYYSSFVTPDLKLDSKCDSRIHSVSQIYLKWETSGWIGEVESWWRWNVGLEMSVSQPRPWKWGSEGAWALGGRGPCSSFFRLQIKCVLSKRRSAGMSRSHTGWWMGGWTPRPRCLGTASQGALASSVAFPRPFSVP